MKPQSQKAVRHTIKPKTSGIFLDRIQSYARTIGRTFRPRQVILFGSYARGEASEDSDVDLLVIMDHNKRRNVDQAIAMRLCLDAPFPMDMLVKRPDEVDERLAMNDTFIKGILEDGKVLYEQRC